MFLLACALFTICSTVMCTDVHVEIEELKRTVGRMEQINERQEKALSNANEEIRALTEEVSLLRKGKSIRGRRQTDTVAFTAYFDHEETVHQGNILKFNRILYNKGNAYNVHTGIFTVPVTGTYIISFQIENWEADEMPFNLMVDGTNMVGAIINAYGSTQSGNTAILGLTAGNAVRIESTSEGKVWGETNFRGTTFCGAFLY